MSATRVLVAEKIGDSGIDLLREHFDVDLGVGWDREELARADRRLRGHPDPLGDQARRRAARPRPTRLRAVGRAGVGVDNVDVAAATKRGIVVANAPESNVITAAEHTMALLLALARNVPQAHASLTGGAWERSKFSGVELYEKTLGILGFGRIGQLVAQRARGFGMRVVAFDPYVGAERYRELGVEQAESPDDVYAAADFLTLHLPKTPGDRGLAQRRGARQVQGRRAGAQRRPRSAGRRRGPEGGARLRQGRRRGARRVPLRAGHRAPAVRVSERDRHPAPGRLDRRGDRPRRLPGRRAGRRGARPAASSPARSTSRRSPPRTWRCSGPFVPLCRVARPDRDRARGRRGRLGRPDPDRVPRPPRRARHPAARRSRCCSARSPATPRRRSTRSTRRRSPRSAGSASSRPSTPTARDYTDLVRVEVTAGEQRGPRRRHADRPPQPPAPARGVGPALRRPARGAHHAVPLPRPARDDRPGRAPRSAQHGVNIVSAAVGRLPDERRPARAAWRRWRSRPSAPVPRRGRRDRLQRRVRGRADGRAVGARTLGHEPSRRHPRPACYAVRRDGTPPRPSTSSPPPLGGNSAPAAARSREPAPRRSQVRDQRKERHDTSLTTPTEY